MAFWNKWWSTEETVVEPQDTKVEPVALPVSGPAEGPGTYLVTLDDGRTQTVNSDSISAAMTHVKHTETDRIYRAAAMSIPAGPPVSVPVSAVKVAKNA